MTNETIAPQVADTAELQKAITVEKNAKNQAYAFIVATGLFANFTAFCQNVHCDNWHEAVVNLIASTLTKN